MRFPLDIPPGLVNDDTSFSAAPRWYDGSNVRFRLGRAQVVGGWESLVGTALTGVCRTVFTWTDKLSVLDVAFGTHSALQLWQGGAVYTITPTLKYPPVILTASSPIATSNGTPTIVVTQAGHPYTTGDSMVITGATAVATVTINGTWTITATTTNTWTFTAGSNASSTTTGGGTAVKIAPQVAFAAGSIDGTGGAGYGTGAYSTGTYSSPSTYDYFPRTWSLSAWGFNLLANPRAGTIYEWDYTNTGVVAAPLLNAPAQVTYTLVSPMDGGYQVFALGCNEEASGVFNPLCIRHSGIRDNTSWTTTSSSTAREYILTGGGRIVAGRMIGSYMLVWTTEGLFLGTFIGNLNQPWKFEQVGRKCGLIGPAAAIVVGQRAFWISPDRQFHEYSLGGEPGIVSCPIRTAFAENLAASQSDKIVASSISEFGEIRFDYPDARDGYENSRYVALAVSGENAGAWYRGIMARTAFVDAGPSLYPIGVTYDGAVYWHERGQSADGSARDWYIETSDQYFDENFTMLCKGSWPDIQEQVGGVDLTITTRYKPQGAETVKGPYTMAPDDDLVDFKAKGRLFKIKFANTSNATPTHFRLGKPVFNVSQAGGR